MRCACGFVALVSLCLAACSYPRLPAYPALAIPAVQLHATPFVQTTTPGPPHQSALQLDIARHAPELDTNCPVLQRIHPYMPLADLTHYAAMSGGGPHGAFGAGFFLGLYESGHLPPEPAVVTGVSTGALQATFVFLARQPVPADRQPYAWANGVAVRSGAIVPGRSNLEDLAVAYSIDRESDILKAKVFRLLGVGATGKLTPLHDRLLKLITPGTIEAVATEACRGRKLYVGAVSLDDGEAYAFNLTALALSAFEGDRVPSPTRMAMVRESYVNALLASSSVPVGALPVHLRIRYTGDGQDSHRSQLFIDGGARNGVFLAGIDQAVTGNDVTLVVNTGLGSGTWSIDGTNSSNPTARWNLIDLASRSVDILTDQVYQLSVATVLAKAGSLHFAMIDSWNLPDQWDPEQHVYTIAGDSRTCAQWRDEDAKAHPLEFDPRYMACLIGYGRQRGHAGLWNKQQ